MAYTVGTVARLAHVSVRTLHHYDELGLLKPSGRSDSGYRLYTDADLAQLQQVLFYKELGFSLDEIAGALGDPAFDRLEAFRRQRELIADRVTRLEAMLDLIDRAVAAENGGIALSKEEMFEVFGDFDPTEHEAEVKERWGETDAYKESTRRTARYNKADWQRFKDESEEINTAIAALIDEGVAPDDPRAMDAVERARLQIDEWFYPCSREMHANLGEMYVADPRFTQTYEDMAPGLATWVRDAWGANAARQEG